ncbi:MAG: PLP-dependent aminotransferase family protein [Rhodospirillales bacterium]|nr:MAG: PLP-dependent aminotransferase family protein [Rhodospirillales bacterium]
MRESLFYLKRKPGMSIQASIREMLVSAILARQLAPTQPLPSSRELARRLGVSRNTVVLAYQGLVDDGFIEARQRSGYFVNPEILESPPARRAPAEPDAADGPDWESMLRMHPGRQPNIEKPDDWQSYPYPFVYGQIDPGLFPIAAWRDCTRQALGLKGIGQWTADRLHLDDPELVQQIRTRVLPRRGIWVSADEILITLGAQNALYLLASLFITPDTTVAMEEPGYPDVRNIFALKTGRIRPIPVDSGGLPVDDRLDGCDFVYVTPSHQFPTTVTMPAARREALLARASESRFVVIEDDYEFETNYIGNPTPALKSMDRDGRVVYVGSLSKTLFPGLRLGYLVGAKPLIEEARALRRLMMRHAPNNNQRTTALFLSLGHHDALVRRLHRIYRARWRAMDDALSRHLPESARAPGFGGTSVWVRGPARLDSAALARAALEEGIVIEPGHVHFMTAPQPRRFFRLGFSAIPEERIEPGVRLLSDLIHSTKAARV